MKKQREDKVKSLRLLEIDRIIREGKYPNATKLCRIFEVSRSTVMRDLEFLRDRYNAPLEYAQERNGYYYSDPTFFIKSVMLSEGELFTVSVMMPLLEQYRNTPLEGSFKSIVDKITAMLPEEVSVNSGFAAKDIDFITGPLPKIEEEVFNNTFQAVKTRTSMEFSYHSCTRKVDPYHVLCHKGGWYVLGYCHAKCDIRIFSLARMTNTRCTKEFFSMPENFNVKDYVDLSFGIWNNPGSEQKYELEFCSSLATLVSERIWHATQELEQLENGCVRLSFVSNQPEEILFWVLGFGGGVKVINPPELAERVRQEAEKILKKYS